MPPSTQSRSCFSLETTRKEIGVTFTQVQLATMPRISDAELAEAGQGQQQGSRSLSNQPVFKGQRGGQTAKPKRKKGKGKAAGQSSKGKGARGNKGKGKGKSAAAPPTSSEKRAMLLSPAKYLTHGASYADGWQGWNNTPAQQVVRKPERKLAPNNAPITTKVLRIVERDVRSGRSLEEAASMQAITRQGFWKAKKREEKCGHATPERPVQQSRRIFPVGSKARAAARTYLKDKNNSQSLQEAGVKFGASAPTLCREFGMGDAISDRRSTRGARSAEAGEKPLTRKRPQKVLSEANMPRVYDMALSWHDGILCVPVHLRSWADESKLKWGDGQHGASGRAEAGKPYNSSQPYRWSNATIYICAGCRDANDPDSWDILKCHIQPKAMKGDDFAKFSLEETPDQGTMNLGGPSLVTTFTASGIKTYEYDMAGRGGRANHPKKGHFHPALKPSMAKGGVRAMHGHPKFGMSDPVELLNNLVQNKCAKYPTNLEDDSGHPLYGPQTYAMAVVALDWAVGELRAEGKIRSVLRHAVEVRARSRYMESLLGSMSFSEEVRQKRASNDRGVPFTVVYRGKDVVCKNLGFKYPGHVTVDEQAAAEDTRCLWLPPPTAAKTKPVRASGSSSGCKCGSTTHFRITNTDCPQNPKGKGKAGGKKKKAGAGGKGKGASGKACQCGSTAHFRITHADCPQNPNKKVAFSDIDSEDAEPHGMSESDSDVEGGKNVDTINLDSEALQALRLDRPADTDSENEEEEDISEQGTQWGNAERISGIQSVCGTLALKCLLSEEGGEERREWLGSVKEGSYFVDFSSQTDEWMEVTEALESYESVCVIHVRGRSAKAQMQARVRSGSKRARGGGIKNALLGQGDGELDPDPRKILTIIYNGRNHFCAVASKGKLKPGSEGSMGAGPTANTSAMPRRLREWLARHNCELWESTPNGYCGYESIAVSLLLLQEDE